MDIYTNAKLLFYSFDFIGLVPQLRIFKYDSYKSIFSTIISIIIIISSIGFSLYSIIDYIKFNNPSISYLKRYDNASNNTILLKDTLFMFKAVGYCNNFQNKYNLDFEYKAFYYNGERNEKLKIEQCKIGNNINSKFKDELEKKDNYTINQFYCISSENYSIPIFYTPGAISYNKGYLLIDIYNYDCQNTSFYISLLTENDIIDHDNKKNPIIISPYYFNSQLYPPASFIRLDYKFEFIRYEDDDGYFFQNSKNFNALGISEIDRDINNRIDHSHIGRILFEQSEKNYSHYKRSYLKIQSFLADMMSIINILIVIGKIIGKILLQKKMNKDIVRSLLNKNIYQKIIESSGIEKNKKEKKLFSKLNERTINSEIKDIKKEKLNSQDNSKKFFKFNKLHSKADLFLEKKIGKKANKSKMMKITILKKLNMLDIIKSYFFDNNKTKLINICDKFVSKDLCIERILDRLYQLEKIFYILSKEELSKLNLHINKKFSEISYYIKEIYKDKNRKIIKKEINK